MSTPEAVNPVRPADAVAFEELEQLVRALGEELARFRKRAHQAETRLKDLEASAGSSDLFSGDRVATIANLEAENRDLRERIDTATERTRSVLDRVRFLRQQTAAAEGA